MPLYREHTPIEEHEVEGHRVFVKRDDLYGIPPAPPLGKLRGLRAQLRTLVADGHRIVGCWDSRVSRLGEGLAVAVNEFPGVRAIVAYPRRKGVDVPASMTRAEQFGATVVSFRGNVTPICYAQARRYVVSEGGTMLPFGLECTAAVDAIAAEAARVPTELLREGTLVLSAGSGVTLAGLVKGLPRLPRRILALSSGRAPRNIARCLVRYVGALPPNVEILQPIRPYYSPATIVAPFPSHPFYDLKAWEMLATNVRLYPSPILFWNIGS